MLPLLLAATALAVPNQVELVPKYRLDTSYVAQALRPGLRVAAEKSLWDSERDRLFTDEKLIREFTGSVGFMGWWHPHNQTPLLATAEVGFRRTGTFWGFQKEALVGMGMGYAINGGRTYRYNDSGELKGNPLGGRGVIAPSMGIGFGQDLSQVKPKLKASWHMRGRMHYQWPYNVAGAPVFTVELGISRPWTGL